jgi:hypothetical protein
MKSIWSLIAAGWCHRFHSDPMWQSAGRFGRDTGPNGGSTGWSRTTARSDSSRPEG